MLVTSFNKCEICKVLWLQQLDILVDAVQKCKTLVLKKQKDWVIEESRPSEGNQKNVDIANQRPFKLSIPFIGLNRFASMRIINSIFYWDYLLICD